MRPILHACYKCGLTHVYLAYGRYSANGIILMIIITTTTTDKIEEVKRREKDMKPSWELDVI